MTKGEDETVQDKNERISVEAHRRCKFPFHSAQHRLSIQSTPKIPSMIELTLFRFPFPSVVTSSNISKDKNPILIPPTRMSGRVWWWYHAKVNQVQAHDYKYKAVKAKGLTRKRRDAFTASSARAPRRSRRPTGPSLLQWRSRTLRLCGGFGRRGQ